MECKFEIGQQVVCINDNFNWLGNHTFIKVVPNRPIKGQKYTIRAIKIIDYSSGEKVGLLLKELINPICEWRGSKNIKEVEEYYFYHKKFAPIQKRETDISIFTKMLNKSPELV